MSFLANIIWIICGGWLQALAWAIAGIICDITIIGIPLGNQCFKFASLSLAPFGKNIYYGGGGISFIANILWIVFIGWEMALASLLNGIALCVTIVGIPLGLQCFKFAKLWLMPFGSHVI